MASNLRLGTVNVHGWFDAEYQPNVERIAALCRSAALDVVALQEVTEHDRRTKRSEPNQGLAALAKELKMHCADTSSSYGCAILSRFPITAHRAVWHEGSPPSPGRRPSKHRAIAAVIQLPGCRVEIVNMHLNYRDEDRRLEEIQRISRLVGCEDAAVPRVWVGDLNSLSAADYSPDALAAVAATRAESNWEPPRFELTTLMSNSLRLVDCWPLAGRVGDLSTCRFGTRIDYVWVEASALAQGSLRPLSCTAVSTAATDHSMVVCDLEIRDNCGKK